MTICLTGPAPLCVAGYRHIISAVSLLALLTGLLLCSSLQASELLAKTSPAATEDTRHIHVVAYPLKNKTESAGRGA